MSRRLWATLGVLNINLAPAIMAFADWIPSIATSSLLAVAVWLARNLIITRLTKSVSAEFDIELEQVRSQLRETEEKLRADLRIKESQIEALRSGSMAALASRQAAVDKRRIEAVDQIWATDVTLGPARRISELLSRLKYEALSVETKSNPKLREALGVMNFGFDPKTIDFASADKARPFVTPMVWAHYSALAAVCTHAITRWHMLKSGLGAENLVDDKSVLELLKVALPHQTDYLAKFGPSVFHFLVDELERNLLNGMEVMLSNPNSDLQTVEQAAKILAASNAVFHNLSPG